MMKTTLKIIAIMGVILAASAVRSNAQVSIGTVTEAPAKAALLDLKDQPPTSENVTSTSGGVVLPRVKLVAKATLEPFIATTDAEWNTSNRANTQKEHVGLTVYNLTSDTNFKQGVYVWSGNEWNPLKISSNYIYLPTFNLTWGGSSGTPNSINLFNVYTNNFSPAIASHHANSRDASVFVLPDYNSDPSDFHYVVTDYHPAIEIYAITPDGVMTYSKAATETANSIPPENVYVNVVMIRK
ncbi:MAG: hypothetical protein LBP72_03870 [Dysgonamonadaceae bacterium]|jgi:hypothetical protein|nr:hypothetical protein [Dysgonamonadaceae bacterium]